MPCILIKSEKVILEFYCRERNILQELLIGSIASLFAPFKADDLVNWSV